MNIKIPVIMYHSVGIPHPTWVWSFLTIPYDLFEDHVGFLKRKHFTSIGFMDYYNHVKHGEELPRNPVFFSFDDGYLDNWVFAYPILKKYGFKGTVFVNPDFVDPAETLRPTLEDVWEGSVGLEDLQVHGFLSWAEMREMEKDGVMEIQSHAMTHTWYFSGPKIVDFKHPGDQYVWMDWNKNPGKKWQYLTRKNTIENQLLGSPVYEHGKSLEIRRYFPDERLAEYLQTYVADQGTGFFERNSWRKILRDLAEEFSAKNPPMDSYESDDEHFSRLNWELEESKRILETQLSKKVEFLCWPGGGYYSESIDLAKKYYLGSTIASWEKQKNPFIMDNGHLRIKRIGCPIIKRKDKMKYAGGRYLFHYLREYQDIRFHKSIRRAMKLLKLVRI